MVGLIIVYLHRIGIRILTHKLTTYNIDIYIIRTTFSFSLSCSKSYSYATTPTPTLLVTLASTRTDLISNLHKI
jgi:hypothetical protein